MANSNRSERRGRRAAWLAGWTFWLGGVASAQWQVDPATTQLDLEGEVYADHECNNQAIPLPCTVPRLMPGDLPGTCPPYFGPHAPLHGAAVIERQGGSIGMNFPSVFDFGNGLSFKAVDDLPPCGPGEEAYSEALGFFVGDGLGSRTLFTFWNTEINNRGIDGNFTTRGCLTLNGVLAARFPAPATTRPWFLRWDFEANGNASTSFECFQQICADCMIPSNQEDPELASMDVMFDVNGQGPGVLLSSFLDSDPNTPDPDVYPLTLTHGFFAFAPGAGAINVSLDAMATASAETQSPNGFDSGEPGFYGNLLLHVIVHDFLVGPDYWCGIPASGPGPRYPYQVGQSEVTNQQYADFLNSAEHDLGQTSLSSHMVFGADGDVSLPDGTLLFAPKGPFAPESRIVYTPAAHIGTRYTVEAPQGSDARSFEQHPVNHVSWIGALKFCNWVTLTQGLPEWERCYAEGPTRDDWRPVTISSAAWATRDLAPIERAALTRKRGVRLPMDDLGGATGWVGDQVRPFNEWYKAAAYDPGAPVFARNGPAGEGVPPLHWTYGFASDAIAGSDANFLASGDPFDDDDAFVALYDGSTYNGPGDPLVGNGATFGSSNAVNVWGLYDMSGNIGEWGQDKVRRQGFAVRGGHYGQLPFEGACTYREAQPLDLLSPFVGFRVVRSGPGKQAHVPPAPPKPASTTL